MGSNQKSTLLNFKDLLQGNTKEGSEVHSDLGIYVSIGLTLNGT